MKVYGMSREKEYLWTGVFWYHFRGRACHNQSVTIYSALPFYLRPPGLVFHEFNLANQPGCCSEDWCSKSILPGTSTSTSVPPSARLKTLRLAPISSLRSRIPDRPKC